MNHLTFLYDTFILSILAQDETNPCALHPCSNGGSCYDQRNSQNNLVRLNGYERYKCFCMRGYSGKNCEVPQYACYSNPCQNSGTCMDARKFSDVAFDSLGFKCICPFGFSGRNCQINTKTVEPGTSNLVSSLSSGAPGYGNPGYVSRPRPDTTATFSNTLPTQEPPYATETRTVVDNLPSNENPASNVPPDRTSPSNQPVSIPPSLFGGGTRRGGKIIHSPSGVQPVPFYRR